MKNRKTLEKKVSQSLEKHQLGESLRMLKQLAVERGDYEMQMEIETMKASYRSLLKYFVEGVADPMRAEVYDKMTRRAWELLDKTQEDRRSAESNKETYRQKRALSMVLKEMVAKSEGNLSNETEAAEQTLRELASQTAKAYRTEPTTDTDRRQHDERIRNLFDLVWLTEATPQAIQPILDGDAEWKQEKAIVVGALLMRLRRRFKSEDMELLLRQAQKEGETQLRARAMVALTLALMLFSPRIALYGELKKELDETLLDEETRKAYYHVLTCLLRTQETTMITHHIQTDLIPKMKEITKEMNPEDLAKIKNFDPDDEEGMGDGENPSWRKKMMESGIADEMMEMTQMLMEGSDVYMSTFEHLKNYNFFKHASSWMRPFSQQQAQIAPLFEAGEGDDFSQAVMQSGLMCDSDKYSLCLTLLHVDPKQREMMSQSMRLSSEQEEELSSEEEKLHGSKEWETEVTHYVQDLQRMWEIAGMFDEAESPKYAIEEIEKRGVYEILHVSKARQASLAEYLFSKKLYEQAYQKYEALMQWDVFETFDTLQKLGYCKEKTGEAGKAETLYEQALEQEPDDAWTLKHAALCAFNAGNHEQAARHYEHLSEVSNLSKRMAVRLGKCYMEKGEWAKALETYFKIDLESKGDEDYMEELTMGIARASVAQGKREQAMRYYQKANTPQAYIEWGHLLLKEGDLKGAVTHYAQSLMLLDNDEAEWERIWNETPLPQGVDAQTAQWVKDAARK